MIGMTQSALKKLVVLPNDPIYKYYEKGEIKPRYFNPGNYFDEVHILSLSDSDIEPHRVQTLAGDARLGIHALGRPSLSSLLTVRARVDNRIRAIQPDCIRAYNPLLMGWYAVSCGKKHDIPTVISIHDDFSIWRRRKTYGKGYWARAVYQAAYRLTCERDTFTKASVIICVYEFIKTHYVERFRQDGIEVIYKRVDLRQFTPRLSAPQKNVVGRDRPLKLLWVGRLFKGKNPTPIIEALPGVNAELTIIGHGPLTDAVRRVIGERGLERQVILIDSVPNEQLPEYYASHDVFAFSSVLPGISIPVLEAMASGLPVVINKPLWDATTPVVGDLALEVENTAAGYRQALQTLLAHPEHRAELSRQVRARALQYDGRIMETKEQAVYRRLVEGEAS